MKNIFSLSLIILLFIFNNIFCSIEGQEFYKGFLKATSDSELIEELPEQCFGKLFDYYFLVLKISYYQNDSMTLISSIENIIIDSLVLNCPLKPIALLLNDINLNLTSQELTSTLYSKSFKLGQIIYNEYTNPNITASSLGYTLGKIVNLFRKNFVEPKFIQEEETQKNIVPNKKIFDENDYFGLFEGLFLGMKKEDNGEESLCYKDVLKGKDEIMKHVRKGMKGVEEGKSVGKMIRTILFNLMTVEGLVIDCNLLSLGGSVISKFTSMKEMMVLYDKIIKNVGDYITILKNIFTCYTNKDLKGIGMNIGKFISKIFDFYVK